MEVFKKFDDSIIRAQQKIYYPTSEQNFNSVNKSTVFKIDGVDSFLNVKQARFDIRGKVVKSDGTAYAAGIAVKLVDNFVAYLFSRIEVRKHGKLLDESENVGRLSTIIGAVMNDHSKENSGFISKFSGGGNFHVIGFLGDLGLGFFTDVKVPVYKGGFDITFIRANDNDAVYRYKADPTTEVPGEAKVTIQEFIIRIPSIDYEDFNKIKLVNELTHLSQNNKYRFLFKSYQCIEERNLTGKTFTKDITNNYRFIKNPLFAFIAFQTGRLDSQIAEPQFFDHCSVKNIWLELNSRRYPEELEDFDFSTQKTALAYEMYTDFKRIFNNNDASQMMLSPTTFKTCAIYCIDLTRQPQNTGCIF
uniref:Double jelly roll-like domain-containing protein n=1 Tax=Cacopsylla melanoneura TaxID=428564 RepID=A0A8D8PTV5_9HEMI